jgi:hypothetical protein
VRRTPLLGFALIVVGILGVTYHSTSYRSLPKKSLYEPAPVPNKRIHPAIESIALPAVGALSLLGGVAILLMDREIRSK